MIDDSITSICSLGISIPSLVFDTRTSEAFNNLIEKKYLIPQLGQLENPLIQKEIFYLV